MYSANHRTGMKIYVVDNGGQWTHLEMRLLKYLKADVTIVPNRTSLESVADADALVLSGGAPGGASDAESMGNNELFLEEFPRPILGICAGMQVMCRHFGSSVEPMASGGADAHGEFGTAEIEVLDDSDLFRGLPPKFTVGISHSDEVKQCPEGFRITARSANCGIEAVSCKDRPLYGVQFHPEVKSSGDNGVAIFRNFLSIVEEHNRN